MRKIAKEHQLDLRQVPGTGSSGRITKDDVLQYIEKGGAARAARRRLPRLAAAAKRLLRRSLLQRLRRPQPAHSPATWCR